MQEENACGDSADPKGPVSQNQDFAQQWTAKKKMRRPGTQCYDVQHSSVNHQRTLYPQCFVWALQSALELGPTLKEGRNWLRFFYYSVKRRFGGGDISSSPYFECFYHYPVDDMEWFLASIDTLLCPHMSENTGQAGRSFVSLYPATQSSASLKFPEITVFSTSCVVKSPP